MSNWIKFNIDDPQTHMPSGEQVLVYTNADDYLIMSYNPDNDNVLTDSIWSTDGDWFSRGDLKVMYWMQLPDPPK